MLHKAAIAFRRQTRMLAAVEVVLVLIPAAANVAASLCFLVSWLRSKPIDREERAVPFMFLASRRVNSSPPGGVFSVPWASLWYHSAGTPSVIRSLAMATPEPDTRAEDAFPRWQKITIDQFSYVQNIVLTFAVAALGYFFTLLRDKDFVPAAGARQVMIAIFALTALSALCGLACAMIRLKDFRGTARRARGRADAPTKESLDRVGKISWALLNIECWSFSVGIAALAWVLFETYGSKLA